MQGITIVVRGESRLGSTLVLVADEYGEVGTRVD